MDIRSTATGAIFPLLNLTIKTNMDFLKPEIRNYFFKQEPAVKTKIDDLPPAKYNPGADVKIL